MLACANWMTALGQTGLVNTCAQAVSRGQFKQNRLGNALILWAKQSDPALLVGITQPCRYW